jgi:YD repeat-containing protein
MAEGLLDFIKTPEGQGLLATAFGGLAGARRGFPINTLGRAGLAGAIGYNAALDRQNDIAKNEMHKALYDAQIGNYNSEVEQRKNALEVARGKQAALSEYLNSITSPPTTTIPTPTQSTDDDNKYVPNQMGFTEGSLPIPDSNGVTVTDIDSPIPSVNSAPQKPTVQVPPILNVPTQDNGVQADRIAIAKLVRAGYSTKDAEELVYAGLPQVARVEETTDAFGQPVKQQYDKFGRRVSQPMQQWKSPVSVDQGNKQTFINPVTLTEVASFGKGQTPDSAAMNPNRPFTLGPNGEYVPNPQFQKYEIEKTKQGATNVVNKIDVKTGEGLAKEIGPMLAASKAAAEGALSQMETVNRLNAAINSGKLIAGPFANQRLTLAQIGQVLGVGGKDNAEILTNSREAIQSLAKFSLDGRSVLKGQGQISDYEGKLLAKATSGDIADLTIPELKVLTSTAERVAKAQQAAHQRNMKVMRSKPELKDVADFYEVPDIPTAPTQPPTTGQTFDAKPPAHKFKGKILIGPDGNRSKSDGMIWKEVK